MKLDLSLEQVQLIVGALGNLPFGQVEALIGTIRSQATTQMNLAAPDPDKKNDEAA